MHLKHEIIFWQHHTHTRTRLMVRFSGTTRVSRYQKGKTNVDFTETRDSEWQWHQLDHMQVCTSLQTDNHASSPPLSFLQAGCPSCSPTNSIKALKAAPISEIWFYSRSDWYRKRIRRSHKVILFVYDLSTLWVKKTRHLTLAHNFTKYWPIFEIFSLLDSVGNL